MTDADADAGSGAGAGVDAETVREIALGLPGTEERLAWGQVTFRVPAGGRIFASLSEDETTMGFRFPMEERDEMVRAEPGKFFIQPGHDDNYHWLRVRLAAIDAVELRAILVDSWRQRASKRLLAEYDAGSHGPDSGRGPV